MDGVWDKEHNDMHEIGNKKTNKRKKTSKGLEKERKSKTRR